MCQFGRACVGGGHCHSVSASEMVKLEFIISGQPHFETFLVGSNGIDKNHGHGEASDSLLCDDPGSHKMKIRLVALQRQVYASKIRYTTVGSASYAASPLSTSIFRIPDCSLGISLCNSSFLDTLQVQSPVAHLHRV